MEKKVYHIIIKKKDYVFPIIVALIFLGMAAGFYYIGYLLIMPYKAFVQFTAIVIPTYYYFKDSLSTPIEYEAVEHRIK